MKKLHFLLINLLLLGFNIALFAQNNVEKQQLFWAAYNLKVKLSDKYQLSQQIEERTYMFPFRQHQALSRTTLDYNIGKGWFVGGGLVFFIHSLPNDPEVGIDTNQTEIRPQLDLVYKQSISDKIAINHRCRNEFRIFEQKDKSFDYTNNRMRYQIEFRYLPTKELTLKAFNEILINLTSKTSTNIFDQNRYGGSVQYMPVKNYGVELGYLKWYQQRPSREDFFSRDIIKLSIHHIIELKKNK